MAFPSSVGSGSLLTQNAIEQSVQIAGAVKQQAQAMLAACQSTGLRLDSALSSYAYFQSAYATLNTISAIPNIGTLAQAQIGSAGENIPQDFTTMLNALQSVVSWISGNFPKDASGNLLYAQFNGSTGALQYTTVPGSSLTALASLLSTLISSIN